MNSVEIILGSYRVTATQQSADRKAWLVTEFSGDQKVNTYALTTKKLARNISAILEHELRGK